MSDTVLTDLEKRDPRERFRTFVWLWGSQALSLIGHTMTLFALRSWVNTTLYPDPAQEAQAAAASTALFVSLVVTQLLVMPLAGAWADRHDRKRIMVTANLINMALAAAMATIVATGLATVPLIVPFVIVMAAVGGFHQSAMEAGYSMLVPPQQLPRANGMMQTMIWLSDVLSPLIAATVIMLPRGPVGQMFDWVGRIENGAALAIGLDACCLLIGACVLAFLRIPSPQRQDMAQPGAEAAAVKKPGIWDDIVSGARYIMQRRPLVWLLLLFTWSNLMAQPFYVLDGLLVRHNLAARPLGLTFDLGLARLHMVAGIGGIVGGLIVSSWGGLKRRRVLGVIVPISLAMAAQIVLGLSSHLYLTAAMAGVVAMMVPVMASHSQAIWQTQTPYELQGRVFAVRRLISGVFGPLGYMAGLVVSWISPGLLLAVLGAAGLLYALSQLLNRSLMRVEDQAAIDIAPAVKAAADGQPEAAVASQQ